VRTLSWLLLGILPATVGAQTPPAKTAVEWPAYGGDARGSRLSPLTDITPANVSTLQIAWRYSTSEASQGP